MKIYEDYYSWITRISKKMRDNSIYGTSSIGFDKLTEMTVDGPRNIDLEYFLELHGETYTIKDIEESVQYKMGEAKDKILKSYLQKRRNDLMKIWIEE